MDALSLQSGNLISAVRSMNMSFSLVRFIQFINSVCFCPVHHNLSTIFGKKGADSYPYKTIPPNNAPTILPTLYLRHVLFKQLLRRQLQLVAIEHLG